MSEVPKYPGLGLPLRHNPQETYGFYPIGAHGSCYGSDSDILPVRELAMMSVMDRLTDKPEWYHKVFDEQIVAKWREEALEIPDEEFWKMAFAAKSQYRSDTELIVRDEWGLEHLEQLEGILSGNAFDCCIQELRSKARYYEKTGIVPTLDACASVAKADGFVKPELHNALRAAFNKLQAEQANSQDWHPNSKEMVQDLVHPSMYPLVYDRSLIVREELVGVSDAIRKWAGKGEVIAKDTWKPGENDRFRYGVGSGTVPPDFWSDTYQWLPSNVAFQDDSSVKFTSYINGLHPNRHPDIYRTIEDLIKTALPMWDQCLGLAKNYNEKVGAGRVKSRFPYPTNPTDSNQDNWYWTAPPRLDDPKNNKGIPIEQSQDTGVEIANPDENFDFADYIEDYRKPIQKPKIPEPVFEDLDYAPLAENLLSQKFKDTGLQVIVKMASIELTPEKPEFPAGGWHIEGQMNETICATALYYLDSENITDSSLAFRMQVSAYLNDDISVGQEEYHWLEQIYGTSLGGGSAPCLQNYGEVVTKQGRLLAFPNVFQHRVSPFELKDKTKPGHRRFIALWLVDPNKRIISTANVPPQQMDWWFDEAFGLDSAAREASLAKLPAEIRALLAEKEDRAGSTNVDTQGVLPNEVMDIVRERFRAENGALPMSRREAEEHRLKLMEVRTANNKSASDWWRKHSHSFCEH
ncbi:hypothetical protein BU24DRAFT_419067 [Aaosphaeria arxii CBS 175.79]|uniref:Uncharacterized protein n=1 Tax=Aaosphaeria arxii CBS 175.79 TaxID=1450172 RepID=A0A6A5Y4K3_9PLEO|nr:uncharacterized protein BU24DRAFT_419067 [Aaosphaeria arxii CBS 175.79]KAF2019444.1 hypothetical protein BU24DRAFT_419067 [Aaosphaeria arxii CBS 175.79]